MRVALITGVTGQDGTYLSEWLVARGYRVVGLTRNVASARSGASGTSLAGVELVEGSIAKPERLREIVRAIAPDEVYHLAAQTGVSSSWEDPLSSLQATAEGALHMLEAVRREAPRARYFHAGSCEMFAADDGTAQDEDGVRRPSSPYGAAKLFAHELTRVYREGHGLYTVSGILFNHESPRRTPAFVTRKISLAAARISLGLDHELRLGRLDPRRDWGFAGDYVRAMWLMLQQDEPEDFVIGTGTSHSVAEFCAAAFRTVGLEWRQEVVSDPAYHRPGDAPVRLANPERARATRLDTGGRFPAPGHDDGGRG